MSHDESALPVRADGNNTELLESVITFYRQRITDEASASKFLSRRGLLHPELLEAFELGFADRELGRRLPPRRYAAGRRLRDRLTSVGIYRTSGHAQFNGCLVAPLRTIAGQLADIYGCRVQAKIPVPSERHRWMEEDTRPLGERRGLLNAGALQGCREVIVTDSVLNAFSFWCADLRNVTCTYGPVAPHVDLVEWLQAAATTMSGPRLERVYLAQRNTEEGDESGAAIAHLLADADVELLQVTFPSGPDANNVLRRLGVEQLRALVTMALPYSPPLYVGPLDPTQSGADVEARAGVAGTEPARPCEAASYDGRPRPSIDDNASTPSQSTATQRDEPAPHLSDPPEPTASPTPRPTAPTTPPAAPPTTQPAAPPATPAALPHETDAHVQFTFDDRHYRVLGLDKNLAVERMKISLRAERRELIHVDSLDLFKAQARNRYVAQAATELYVDESLVKQDVTQILRELEQLQDQQIRATMQIAPEEEPHALTDTERKAAETLLRDPKLLDRILADYDRLGLVGERTNKLVCYLACVSRLLDRPLALMIQSSSAAGKTTLMDGALSLVPPEHQIRYSAMTGQSLYYMGPGKQLKHKILAVAEEEGVAEASYALKLLQSDGQLKIASAGKNSRTGRQQTEEYEVEGPVMMFLTTTAEEPDVELQNRCITLRVNESAEQTAAIHARQREAYTLDGQMAEEQGQQITALHQNAQRLLEPVRVVIPWAAQLTFRQDQIRMRRDHVKYLALIASVTLLHQQQRPRKTDKRSGQAMDYIESTLDDVDVANRLASEALGQSLDDLLPQTRQLLVLLDDHVSQLTQQQKKPRLELRLTQREMRECTGWSDRQLRRHLARLVAMEYVLVYRTGRGNERQYQLLYDGQGRDGKPFLLGLIDTAALRKHQYDDRTGGSNGRTGTHPAGHRRPFGPHPAAGTGGASASRHNGLHQPSVNGSKNGQAAEKNAPLS